MVRSGTALIEIFLKGINYQDENNAKLKVKIKTRQKIK